MFKNTKYIKDFRRLSNVYVGVHSKHFFTVALYIHDPVYRLGSPGKYLNTVETWDEGLQKLGGENTAYWPNQVVQVPQEVRFIIVFYRSPFS